MRWPHDVQPLPIVASAVRRRPAWWVRPGWAVLGLAGLWLAWTLERR